MHAEDAYLFRHALLRDAAYQLQLPGDRAKLHALAFEIIEQVYGGRAPIPGPLGTRVTQQITPHATDTVAAALADHANNALLELNTNDAKFSDLRKLYLRRAAEFAERSNRFMDALSAWKALATEMEGASQGGALRRAAKAMQQIGNIKDAEQTFERVLEIYRGNGDHYEYAVSLHMAAGVYWATGRQDRAMTAYSEAEATFRACNDTRAQGATLGGLALVQQTLGDVQKAEGTFGQAVELSRQAGDKRAVGVSLGNLASIFYESGRFDLAEHAFTEALAIHRDVGNRREEGVTWGNMALAFYVQGRHAEVEQCLLRALEIHREVGNRRSEALALGNIACERQAAGRFEEAEELFLQALAIQREIADQMNEGCTLGNLAGLYSETHRYALAKPAFVQALQIHRQTGNLRFVAGTLCNLSLMCIATGADDEAVACWRDGTGILRKLNETPMLKKFHDAMHEACLKAGVPLIDDGNAADAPGGDSPS